MIADKIFKDNLDGNWCSKRLEWGGGEEKVEGEEREEGGEMPPGMVNTFTSFFLWNSFCH